MKKLVMLLVALFVNHFFAFGQMPTIIKPATPIGNFIVKEEWKYDNKGNKTGEWKSYY